MVELFIELGELSHSSHDISVHEVGSLKGGEALLGVPLESVHDDGLVEEDGVALEEVGSVTSDLLASLRLVTVDHPKKLRNGGREERRTSW